MRPTTEEYGTFYQTYVGRVHGENVGQALEHAHKELKELANLIPERLADYRYAEGKWTVKQLLQHLIDTERVMAFRALWIARGDEQALSGFDENSWASAAPAAHRSLSELLQEFEAVRQATRWLFRSFPEKVLLMKGEANHQPVSVRALAYIIAGHQEHHIEILKTRYLV